MGTELSLMWRNTSVITATWVGGKQKQEDLEFNLRKFSETKSQNQNIKSKGKGARGVSLVVECLPSMCVRPWV
jgi:hypothetical protein